MAQSDCNILLVTFPAQGHINPTLQLAKRVAQLGAKVTFCTTVFAARRMAKNTAALPNGLTIIPFSDGYDDGYNLKDGIQEYISSLITLGSQAIGDLVVSKSNKGHPVTHVVYTTLIPWVGKVASGLHVPSTLYWIQPATLFNIYYFFFNGYEDVIKKCTNNSAVELPGLPAFAARDLPSFLLKSSPDLYNFALPSIKEHMEILEKQEQPRILVNTFDALEPMALKAIKKFKVMGIGPSIPSAFLDGKNPCDNSFGGDLLEKSRNDVEWLNAKPNDSVVYIAFGSFSDLPLQQLEEIAYGLIETRKPFFWVIRASSSGERLEERLSTKDELEKLGLIVPWCSQVEVLSHSCVGCFVTHCGWNSSLESLVCGVPVVGIPLWTDQSTNAKLLQDVWKTGVRAAANEEGIVGREEIKRCLELVMESEEMKGNASKWRELAKDAVKDGGSSSVNLKAFLAEAGLATEGKFFMSREGMSLSEKPTYGTENNCC